ncbi:Hypothetical predicted protein [Cloeon dipterum]|uniref:SOSS complex subunit C homolog n=1 Tax=Cloeon dipterum TaxID=197152 RepID=A0A8S1CH50_9INSE|nr:Hypothetical predicted protein [Cloeon dipterum]
MDFYLSTSLEKVKRASISGSFCRRVSHGKPGYKTSLEMSFQSQTPPVTPNMRQELQNKKILEDLHQQKKQLLLKQGTQLNNASAAQTQAHEVGNQRSIQLQLAHSQSFGFFVPQDSAFGNFILPVLPRFDSK